MLLAIAGVFVALSYFTAHDDATTSTPAESSPGRPYHGPVPLPADVRRGNVVLVADAGSTSAARALATDVAGPAAPALRAAGQAVLVRDRARGGSGVVAYAHDRSLAVGSAADPQLRAFVEYWLGRGAG